MERARGYPPKNLCGRVGGKSDLELGNKGLSDRWSKARGHHASDEFIYNTAIVAREVFPIYIAELSLINFRNYEELKLRLEPGAILINGENGQGKSNLLEAIYILAIAKSPRASTDRELVRWQSTREESYTQVSAVISRGTERTRVQIDLRSAPATSGEIDEPGGSAAQAKGHDAVSVQKYIRINGAPRRPSQLVGVVNAVMFSADDLELVYGPPTLRRRYLDILISQLDRQYLRAVQRYQRVIYQRNHLLKTIGEGRARVEELQFWDEELVSAGKYIMGRRLSTVRRLSELATPIHRELTSSGEGLEMLYRPSISLGTDVPDDAEETLAQALRCAMEAQRNREIGQGFSVVGPHRDDLQMLIDGVDAGIYASRGQSRTVALAMKLAEASYLMEARQEEPVLLLDDVLSELDGARRGRVLDRATTYQQCFITTADPASIGEGFLSRSYGFVVRRGQVEKAGGLTVHHEA